MTPPDGMLRVRAFTDPGRSFGIAVYIDHRTEDGKRAVGEVVFREVSGPLRSDAAIVLEEQEAQRLAEDLYAAGLRPRAAMGSAGQLEAVQAHLETLKAELSWAKARLGEAVRPEQEIAQALARATESLKEQTELNVLGSKALETARSREGMERARADRAERSMRNVEDAYQREVKRLEDEVAELKRQRDERLREVADAEDRGAKGLAREAALRNALAEVAERLRGTEPRASVREFIAATLGA